MADIIDKKHAAVCGLFCRACHVFIATQEDPDRLAALARRYERPLEEIRCHGCRSDKRCFYCRTVCAMAACAAGRGVEFCGACAEYPCKELKTFQTLAPHRIELWRSQARIREAGWEAWYTEMIERYSCPSCRTMNSAYDLKCRKCSHDPSCEYVRLHKKDIEKHLAKAK